MKSISLKVLNWNIEWKRFSSKSGRLIHEILQTESPDLMCLSESHADDSPVGYHGIFSEEDYGYRIHPHRRKVALWSKTPWTDCSNMLPEAPQGRFVYGITSTKALGDLRVLGLCVPWAAAHVSTGRKDRQRWQDHTEFLNALSSFGGLTSDQIPTLLIGDFNQTSPPKHAPEPVRKLLAEFVARFQIIPKAQPEIRSVCHMLIDGALTGKAERDIPNCMNDTQLSDHRGHIASLWRR